MAETVSAQEAEHPHPAPQRATKGIGSVSFKSEITYASTGQVEAVSGCFVFPDRARLDFEMKAKTGLEIRSTLALFGETIQRRAKYVTTIEGKNRPLARMSFETKRALLFWPRGFEWLESDASPTEREALVRPYACCQELDPVGRLVAQLDEEGRPRSIQAFHGKRSLETLTVLEWGEQRGRPYPVRIEVSSSGKLIMEERLTEFRVNGRYIDDFFQLEESPKPGTKMVRIAEPMRVVERPLLAMTFRRQELKGSLSWEAAIEAASKVRARLEAEGLELDSQPTFELSPNGQPIAYVAQLSERRDEAPEGWENIGERTGYLLFVKQHERTGAAQIAALHKALPEGSRSGLARIKILSKGRGAVLMLTPRKP